MVNVTVPGPFVVMAAPKRTDPITPLQTAGPVASNLTVVLGGPVRVTVNVPAATLGTMLITLIGNGQGPVSASAITTGGQFTCVTVKKVVPVAMGTISCPCGLNKSTVDAAVVDPTMVTAALGGPDSVTELVETETKQMRPQAEQGFS